LKYGNEPSLRSRLKRLIDPFKELLGDRQARLAMVSAIVDTRNYLTHFDVNLEGAAAKGNDLWVLCRKVEAIIQLNMLLLIGLSADEVKAIATSNRELKARLGIH
jgi:hypothetical protein